MPKFRIIHATTGSRSSKIGNVAVIIEGYPREEPVHKLKKERLEPTDYYAAAHKIVTNAFMAEEVGASSTLKGTLENLARGNLFGEQRVARGWEPIAGSAVNIGELLQTMKGDPAEDSSWYIFKLIDSAPDERHGGHQGSA